MKYMAAIVIAIAAAVAVFFEKDSGPSEAARIGALMPMTGGLQVYGQTSLNGVRMAVDEVNAAGGVLGGQLGLAVGDTQTNPQSGVDAAKRLVTTDKVSGLVGALSSGVTIPVASSVSSVEQVPQVSGASTSPVVTTLKDNDFLFRTVPSDALQGVILADLMEEKGLTEIGVVYLNNDYGQGLAEAVEGAFDGKITAMVPFEEKQASYRAELQKVKDSGAETLVLIAYPGDGIPILRQALEEQLFAKFVFTDGMKAQEVVDAIGGNLLDGAYGTAPSVDTESTTAKAFKQLYETKYGELPPQPFIDAAYDATILLALAIQKAGSPDGVAVRDALRAVSSPPGRKFTPGQFAAAKAALEAGEDIDYDGAAGSQDFDANGDVPGTYVEWAVRAGNVEDVRLIRPSRLTGYPPPDLRRGVVSSGIRPAGRVSRIICKRMPMSRMRSEPARVWNSMGSSSVRKPEADQIPQITNAPTTAPRLLPLPPAISITQTTKVVIRGSNASGLMKAKKWA